MKHVTLAQDLKEFARAARLLIVHAEDGWIDLVSKGEVDFFTKLAPALHRENVASVVVGKGTPLSDAMLAQNHLHVVLGKEPGYRPGLFHVAPSYVWGFWYLDEVGVNAHSSIGMRSFRPHGIDWGAADWFFHGVAGYMLENNISRAPQPDRGSTALEPARSVIFCQEIEARRPREHYLSTEAMIRNAARAAGGGIVYVKPHPYASEAERGRIERFATSDPNIRISDASVHDLVQVSDWVVTQNSAAGFEALMHRAKVVTCGRADYHQATRVARTEDELRAILRGGPGPLEGFEYERFVYWFLSECCLEPQADGFADRAWARITQRAAP